MLNRPTGVLSLSSAISLLLATMFCSKLQQVLEFIDSPKQRLID